MVQQRHNMYCPIHKALRHVMYSTADTLGIADFRDDEVAREAIGSMERAINLLEVHAEHEETYVHPELNKRAPSSNLAIGP